MLKRINNKAQALVEFVILLPIIIMILFIVIDFAFVFYNKNTLEGMMNDVALYKQKGKSYEEIKSTLPKDVTLSYKNNNNKSTMTLTTKIDLITPFASTFFNNPYEISTERVILNE